MGNVKLIRKLRNIIRILSLIFKLTCQDFAQICNSSDDFDKLNIDNG